MVPWWTCLWPPCHPRLVCESFCQLSSLQAAKPLTQASNLLLYPSPDKAKIRTLGSMKSSFVSSTWCILLCCSSTSSSNSCLSMRSFSGKFSFSDNNSLTLVLSFSSSWVTYTCKRWVIYLKLSITNTWHFIACLIDLTLIFLSLFGPGDLFLIFSPGQALGKMVNL